MITTLTFQWKSLLVLLGLALALAPVDITLTKAVITKPFRDWLQTRSEMLKELFSCPYCMSHWLSFITMCLFHVTVIETGWVFFNFFLSLFALTALTCFFVGLLFRAIDI